MTANKDPERLLFHRIMLPIAGATYLIWWVLVEWLLPGAFNPLPSRLAVSLAPMVVVGLTFFVPFVRRNIKFLFAICCWLTTLHYFYLFWFNKADINWVVGSYITVIAIWSCLQGRAYLLSYSIFVLVISTTLSLSDTTLLHSIFLSGMITILIFANFGARTREKLEASFEAVRLRDEFISMASHELKTPLTTLKLHAQFERRSFKRGDPECLNLDRTLAFVEQTERQTDRLSKLVERMLDVSKISLRSLKLEKQAVNFSQLLREAVDDIYGSPTASSRPPNLEISVEPNLFIYADRERIAQVVANLVDNAVKFGDGKPIKVRAYRDGANVCLTVEDEGVGISKEHHRRIFEKFERAVPFKNISGMGMGLYIARQIVEAHAGHIDVKSAAGQGACFTVVLPFKAS